MSALVLLTVLLAPAMAAAQTPPPAPSIDNGVTLRPSGFMEGTLGHAGFVDDATIHHFVAGGSVRFVASNRLAVGPEVIYMRGPADDRRIFLTGIAVFDLTEDVQSGNSGPRAVPFIIAGGGITRMRRRTGTGIFTSWEGALTAGGGMRIPVGSRWYIAPDIRVGWEPHLRVGVALGVR